MIHSRPNIVFCRDGLDPQTFLKRHAAFLGKCVQRLGTYALAELHQRYVHDFHRVLSISCQFMIPGLSVLGTLDAPKLPQFADGPTNNGYPWGTRNTTNANPVYPPDTGS